MSPISESSLGRPEYRCGLVHFLATSRRCHRSRVSGRTGKAAERSQDRTLLTEARRVRSEVRNSGRFHSAGEHGQRVAKHHDLVVPASVALPS